MTTERMRAVVASRPGGPEVLTIEMRPWPVPAAGRSSSRSRRRASTDPTCCSGWAFIRPRPAPAMCWASKSPEWSSRAGRAPRLSEGARVTALVPGGGYADYCVAHETNALPIPNGLTAVEAAAIPETFFTVWTNVFERGALKTARPCWCMAGPRASARRPSCSPRPSARASSRPRGRRRRPPAAGDRRRCRGRLPDRGFRRPDEGGNRRPRRERDPRHGRRRLCRAELWRRRWTGGSCRSRTCAARGRLSICNP